MSRLGKYELHKILGRGGFGMVYRATDLSLDRVVAIKILHPQLTVDPELITRFQQEAKIIASLEHPNIVGIYETDEIEGRYFIAMRYYPGGSLADLLQQGALPWEKAMEILAQICNGVQKLHERGWVHRDLKPSNILFDAEGRAVVSDFGLARALTSTRSSSSAGIGAGTPFYRAPELWRGKPPATPATDIYSLGCILGEMLTGKAIFSGDTPDEVLTKHLIDGPDFGVEWPLSGKAGRLKEVVEKAICRSAPERYQNAVEMVDAAQAALGTSDEMSMDGTPSAQAVVPTAASTAPVEPPPVPEKKSDRELAATPPVSEPAAPREQKVSPATAPPRNERLAAVAVSQKHAAASTKKKKPGLLIGGVILGLLLSIFICLFIIVPMLSNNNGTPSNTGIPTEAMSAQPTATFAEAVVFATQAPAADSTMVSYMLTAAPTATTAPAWEPTTAPPAPPVSRLQANVKGSSNANARQGPGENYPIYAIIRTGQVIYLIGRNADASWVAFKLEDGITIAWISSSLLNYSGSLMDLPFLAAPTPFPQPTQYIAPAHSAPIYVNPNSYP